MTNQTLEHFLQLLVESKEYVASLIGLYKNNGAVLYVGNFFLRRSTNLP